LADGTLVTARGEGVPRIGYNAAVEIPVSGAHAHLFGDDGRSAHRVGSFETVSAKRAHATRP